MKFTKSETVATTRTGWYIAFVIVLSHLITRFTGLNLDPDDLADNVIVVGAATILYRAALYLSAKFTWIGVIFFGINTPPEYDAPAPPLDADVILPPDKGATNVEVMVGILLLLAVFFLGYYMGGR